MEGRASGGEDSGGERVFLGGARPDERGVGLEQEGGGGRRKEGGERKGRSNI